MADEQEQQDERRGPLRRLAEAYAGRSGLDIRPAEETELLEASDRERRALQKELDMLAYSALDYFGGSEQDLKAVERRKLVQRSRVAWQRDPQLGGVVDLINDFTFGRGVPAPKCADPEVQKVVEDAWDDPDNQLVLTTHSAQVALGTDLQLQSNLFVLVFDEGDDGKVKLGLLSHDTVENVVRDPDNRIRILYYAARERQLKWDFKLDQPALSEIGIEKGKSKLRYFEHWRNVKVAEEEGAKVDKPEAEKLGKGRVYHVSVNRTTEMAFGHPVMERVLRWASAYNTLAEARVDIAKAAAAFIMKRKVKGSPNQVAKMASQALSRRSRLGASQLDDPDVAAGGGRQLVGPDVASILNENAQVDHEPFALDSKAGNAQIDGAMIRSQVSAATHVPQHYLGDASNANLATAQALELPVMKAIERNQEVFEQLFRWFVDMVIEKAVDAGTISKALTQEEIDLRKQKRELESPSGQGQAAPIDEQEANERDLSYELSMPSPLRRTMTDLSGVVAEVAKTFDPNGTNLELSRALLPIVLGEALEVNEPGDVVDRIFPPGYRDPALEAMQQQQQPPTDDGGAQPRGGPNPASNGGAETGPQGEGNPYSVRGGTNPYGSLAEGAGGELAPGLRLRALERGDKLAEELAGALERVLTKSRPRPRGG